MPAAWAWFQRNIETGKVTKAKLYFCNQFLKKYKNLFRVPPITEIHCHLHKMIIRFG